MPHKTHSRGAWERRSPPLPTLPFSGCSAQTPSPPLTPAGLLTPACSQDAGLHPCLPALSHAFGFCAASGCKRRYWPRCLEHGSLTEAPPRLLGHVGKPSHCPAFPWLHLPGFWFSFIYLLWILFLEVGKHFEYLQAHTGNHIMNTLVPTKQLHRSGAFRNSGFSFPFGCGKED